MARADLLKKLFSSYKQDDREMFYAVALEIIEDEKKKNHGVLADDLKLILNGNYQAKKTMMTSLSTPKDKDKDIPLVEVIYPEKYFTDIIISDDKVTQLEQIIKEFNPDIIQIWGSEFSFGLNIFLFPLLHFHCEFLPFHLCTH